MNELMEKISYSIHRSYRKTIAITITPEGEVLVKAPKRLPKAFIEGFVSSKADWIADALEKRKKLEEQKKNFRLESICFLGGEYPVRTGPAGSAVRFTGKYFQVPKGPKEEQMRQVTLWKMCIRDRIYDKGEVHGEQKIMAQSRDGTQKYFCRNCYRNIQRHSRRQRRNNGGGFECI